MMTRGFAIAHLIGAAGLALFWVSFYAGIAIPRAELEDKIPNFDAYYEFEKAFTVPDLTTAIVMTFAAIHLLMSPNSRAAKHLLVAASGALVFLTLLDVNYALRHGLYSLGHRLSIEIMSVPLVGLLGVATIAWFLRSTSTRWPTDSTATP